MRLSFEGCHNFRAVEGWQTDDGRRVATGRFFRSDGLDQLTSSDHDLLTTLKIATVIDLRSSAEIHSAPSRWPSEWSAHSWSGAESAAEADISSVMANARPKASECRTAMMRVYAKFGDDLAAAVFATSHALASADEAAVLVHCAAGKDRTGFVVAALLTAIGVSSDDVMDDYLLSNASIVEAHARFNMDGRLDALDAKASGAVHALLGAHADYLTTALQTIKQQHGSIAAWMSRKARVSEVTLQRIKDRLLV